ncbi:MAG: hypothetical protein KDC05_13940 [Bacteroidales bacterium]|nr:hypothetical protein [Bacteroidales bacterium]
MINKITFLLVFSINLISGPVFAQTDPVLRIEIPAQSDEANYKVIACGETGFLMFYQTTVAEDAYKFWVFIFYNKIMQEVWKKEIPIFDHMGFAGEDVKDDAIYLFYHNPDKKKNDSYNFQIMKLGFAEGRYELFSGNVPDKSTFVEFEVVFPMAFVGFNLEDQKAGFYRYDLNKKEFGLLTEFTETPARIEDIYTDEVTSEIFAIYNVHLTKTEQYLDVREYSPDGTDSGKTLIRPVEGKKFNTARFSRPDKNTRLIFGTFDYIKGNSIDRKDYFEKSASGFFATSFSGSDEVLIHYQDFLELENMTGYLRSKEYMQARKKAEKQEEFDEKSAVNYNLLLHDVIRRDSLFYFIGEAYYEDYHTVTSTYYDYYGRAVPVSYTVFDGYRYFNAFISCYNQHAVKLWDNGMEIFNLLTFDLSNRVNILFDKNDIVLAYNYEGKIGAKIIDGPNVVEGVEYYPLETLYGNDKIISDTKGNMRPWYDNYFLAWGFQTIRNNSLINNNKRTVFYINKVAFE